MSLSRITVAVQQASSVAAVVSKQQHSHCPSLSPYCSASLLFLASSCFLLTVRMFPPPSRRGVSGPRLLSRLPISSSSPVVLCGLACTSVVLLVFVASYLPAVLLPLLGVTASHSSEAAAATFSPLSASLSAVGSVGRAVVSSARSAASLPSILEWRPPSLPSPAAQPVPVHDGAPPAARPARTAPATDSDRELDPSTSSSAWRAKADAIKAAFVHAYSKYENKCFGQDEYRPVEEHSTHSRQGTSTDSSCGLVLLSLPAHCSNAVPRAWLSVCVSVCVSCPGSATTGWAPL